MLYDRVGGVEAHRDGAEVALTVGSKRVTLEPDEADRLANSTVEAARDAKRRGERR